MAHVSEPGYPIYISTFAFVYALIAGRLERTPVAGTLVCTAFGLAVGPEGLNWLALDVHAQNLRTLAELTPALVLFTDAANTDLSVLKLNYTIPERLLLVGLPLTILLRTAAAALLFPKLGMIKCALLATMLAPTDAALGKAVVTNPAVPSPIREGLNVESGLNDGICVPILLILLAFAAEPAGAVSGNWCTATSSRRSGSDSSWAQGLQSSAFGHFEFRPITAGQVQFGGSFLQLRWRSLPLPRHRRWAAVVSSPALSAGSWPAG